MICEEEEEEEEEEESEVQLQRERMQACLSIEVREAVGNLEAMGFTDREANLAMLQKHGNNVELALNELLA